MFPNSQLQNVQQQYTHGFHPYQKIIHSEQGPIIISIPSPQNYGYAVPQYQQQVNHNISNAKNYLQAPGSASANRKVPEKKKRTRLAFTDYQKSILFVEFSKNPYVSQQTRKRLSVMLNIPERNIKVWYQNRRMDQKNGEMNLEVSTCNGVLAPNYMFPMPLQNIQNQSNQNLSIEGTNIVNIPHIDLMIPQHNTAIIPQFSCTENQEDAVVTDTPPVPAATSKQNEIENLVSELNELCEQHSRVSSTSDFTTETKNQDIWAKFEADDGLADVDDFIDFDNTAM